MPSKPAEDEIEISVFGPGFGEAILIHVGSAIWIAIDSCINRRTNEPASISYLKSIGVDPTNAIKLVIASHWHDDHVKGLRQLVAAASSGEFCCSEALIQSEFTTLLSVFNKDPQAKVTGGLNEFYGIFNDLLDAGRSPKLIGKDRTVLRVSADILKHGSSCEVVSLSPSDAQKALFLRSIGDVHVYEKKTKFRHMADDPNQVSVACQIIVGNQSLLLGADLERSADILFGWDSVISSTGRPLIKSKLFKIPHHGSENGHHEGVWEHMLLDQAIAIITPYSKLADPLPKDNDLKRIKSYTSEAYCTAASKKKQSQTLDRSVAKTIGEIGAKIRVLPTEPGRVTVRFAADGSSRVELDQTAYKI